MKTKHEHNRTETDRAAGDQRTHINAGHGCGSDNSLQDSPVAQRQQQLSEAIDTSPRMALQRRQLQQSFGAPIQRQGSNNGLPENLKAGIEQLSGMDMSDVRVHKNSSKPAQVKAAAYAQGADIHLGPGQEHHLPHEAWHTVQQKQGRVKPTVTVAGQQVNDDVGLEHEADVMGAKAMQHKPVQCMEQEQARTTPAAVALQRVIQCGDKYDALKGKVEQDADDMDYSFARVDEDALKAATKEILIEQLTGKEYVDLKGDELATPEVMLSGSWGGIEGMVLLPAKVQSAMQIQTGEFIPNLMHEIGHMVKGQKDSTAMKDAIAEIAKQARTEAAKPAYADAAPKADAWEEELRADLTGVHMRWLAGSNPKKSEYASLGWADDSADESHPPGAYRVQKIGEYLAELAGG